MTILVNNTQWNAIGLLNCNISPEINEPGYFSTTFPIYYVTRLLYLWKFIKWEMASECSFIDLSVCFWFLYCLEFIIFRKILSQYLGYRYFYLIPFLFFFWNLITDLLDLIPTSHTCLMLFFFIKLYFSFIFSLYFILAIYFWYIFLRLCFFCHIICWWIHAFLFSVSVMEFSFGYFC